MSRFKRKLEEFEGVPRSAIAAAIVLIAMVIGLGWWETRRSATADFHCTQAYAAAQTAADTAEIDQRPVAYVRGRRPTTCGILRLQGG